jgi:hypothetical protein
MAGDASVRREAQHVIVLAEPARERCDEVGPTGQDGSLLIGFDLEDEHAKFRRAGEVVTRPVLADQDVAVTKAPLPHYGRDYAQQQ